MSRAQLTSTVEQNSAGAASPFLAGKNKIINGDFYWSQRGTSFSLVSGQNYTLDRFYNYLNAGSITSSQQAFDYSASPAADKLPISSYGGVSFMRLAQTGGG